MSCRISWSQGVLFVVLACAGCGPKEGDPTQRPTVGPVPVIFDTDMGNDIDDALALGVLHALQSRNECKILAVTLTKDEPSAAAFCDVINTFYGRGDIPIGVVKDGKTPEPSNYTGPVADRKVGQDYLYPHDLVSGNDAPDAIRVLRQVLAGAEDHSVVMIQVGFSSNLARLLDSPADDVAPLTGKELVAKKCRLLSMMAGWFTPDRKKEYNVFVDVPSARKVFADWPTPIVVSGFEIGLAIKYPAVSIERDFDYVANHPLKAAYPLYQKMPYDRETWDLTSALYAVRPDRGYFDLSPPGRIEVDDAAVTQWTADPSGPHRFLMANAEQVATVREALVQLASQPPSVGGAADGR